MIEFIHWEARFINFESPMDFNPQANNVTVPFTSDNSHPDLDLMRLSIIVRTPRFDGKFRQSSVAWSFQINLDSELCHTQLNKLNCVKLICFLCRCFH